MGVFDGLFGAKKNSNSASNIDNVLLAYLAYRNSQAEEVDQLDKCKELEVMLQNLKRSIHESNVVYEKVAIESGFCEQMTGSGQMLKDLWLHTISKLVSFANMDINENTQTTQFFMNELDIQNIITAEEHNNNLLRNPKYLTYFTQIFDGNTVAPGAFWVFLSAMSGNEKERLDETMGFTRNYINITVAIAECLNYIFCNATFKEKAQVYVDSIVAKTTEFLAQDAPFENYVLPEMNNPLV